MPYALTVNDIFLNITKDFKVIFLILQQLTYYTTIPFVFLLKLCNITQYGTNKVHFNNIINEFLRYKFIYFIIPAIFFLFFFAGNMIYFFPFLNVRHFDRKGVVKMGGRRRKRNAYILTAINRYFLLKITKY